MPMELLKELGAERQILLFSCHSREAAWAEAQGVPVCRLQSAGFSDTIQNSGEGCFLQKHIVIRLGREALPPSS